MIVRYARVSSASQPLDVQIAALRDAGCTEIYREKESGAKTDRQQLAEAIGSRANGDT